MALQSKEYSYIPARDMAGLKKVVLDSLMGEGATESEFDALKNIGIDIPKHFAREVFAMDSIQPTVTTGSIPVPVQFLQNFMTGTVNVLTSARKSDEMVGQSTQGAWEDEEVVQKILEHTGKAVPYGDYTNIPLSSWNLNYERRTIVRFEEGMMVGRLEEARSSRVDINSGAEKRAAAALSLEINRDDVAFNGFNDGLGRTYGLLNDPNLLAYNTVPNGQGGFPEWSTKTFLEITADIRQGLAALRNQSSDQIDPETTPLTLALATTATDYLSVTSDFGNSVRDWIKENYPTMRIVSVPKFVDANGGASVGYLYADSVVDGSTDDGRTFIQVVPSKFTLLGVEQKAKGYSEDYTNATAGVMTKRPFAVYRMTGI